MIVILATALEFREKRLEGQLAAVDVIIASSAFKGLDIPKVLSRESCTY